ncbi:hypothetical protein JCM1840_004784 [Sporobolomyces johnsonii]
MPSTASSTAPISRSPATADGQHQHEPEVEQGSGRSSPELAHAGSDQGQAAKDVHELLEKALSLTESKDGGGELGEDARRGGAPGENFAAVGTGGQRISPPSWKGSSHLRTSSRSPASRTNSNGSTQHDHSQPPSHFRNPSAGSIGRPPQYRPQLGYQHYSQQRISPTVGWRAGTRSPSASSESTGYALPAFNPSPQFYWPHQPQYPSHHDAYAAHQQAMSGVYHHPSSPAFVNVHPYASPPYTSPQQHDLPPQYPTGFAFTSAPPSQPMWYPVYQTPTASPGGPAAPSPEGHVVYGSEGSPVTSAEPLQMMQGHAQMPHLQYSQAPPPAAMHVQSYGGVDPSQSGAASASSPYQQVYFSPPAPHSNYAPSGPSPVEHGYTPQPASTATAPSQPQPLTYPISSARPSTPAAPSEISPASASAYPDYPIRSSGTHWPASQHSTPEQHTSPTTFPLQPSYPAPHRAIAPLSPVTHPLILPPPPPPVPLVAATGNYPSPATYRAAPFAAPAPPPPVPPAPVAHYQSRSQPPKVYAPPNELARGQLAQTRLREAACQGGADKPARATREEGGERPWRKSNMPKPPAHSPHALWVGNVPSDASHAELWQFFMSRPSPASYGLVAKAGEYGLDLQGTGVESIHLIARSNCAFINYVSDLHLQHAIAVSNGQSLRPQDNRCKNLVCRVRKQEDDTKSGVGAQRVGGMHKVFVREQRERMAASEQVIRKRIEEEGQEPTNEAPRAFANRRQSSGEVSAASGSTTSSFLAKHFEKRWFIMKSHDEGDLKLSVETGLWATQSHNEPVLSQAFRTAREVYLVFSANGSGEWFGYARMAGPISPVPSSKGSGRPSWSSRASVEEGLSSTSLSNPSQTILEDANEPSSFPVRPPVLFSPSEKRLAQSPNVITPSPSTSRQQQSPAVGAGGGGGSAPPKLPGGMVVNAAAKRAMSAQRDLMAQTTAENLHLPEDAAVKKAASYDPEALASAKKDRARDRDEEDEERDRDAKDEREGNDEKAETLQVGVVRAQDMLLGPEAVNAKLEKVAGGENPPPVARQGSSASWGTPFPVEWIKVSRLPFTRTRHIRNSFNGNREVKVSRDGTEVEPSAGQALLDEFSRLSDALEGSGQPNGLTRPASGS